MTTAMTAPNVGALRSVMDHPDQAPGDFDAARAFDDHGSALLGFAVNALRDRALAEDCVQETFLRAWRARERFDRDRASERTWLFAIERNVIADTLRARQRMPRIVQDHALDAEPATGADPLDRLRIAEGLAKLSDEHREVVIAIHLEGLTYGDLAGRTGIPLGTLRTRAFYALRALRAHLDESEEADDASR